MSEIPKDIMNAAEEALDNLLCNCVESCGGAAGLRKASIEDIAKAILAERNSHASIFEENRRLREYFDAREHVHSVGLLNASEADIDRIEAARAALKGTQP